MRAKQIASLFLVVSICVRVSTGLIVRLSPFQTTGISRVIGRHGGPPRPYRVALAATSSKTQMLSTDYLICGGGPAGLLSAIMLAQTFPEVNSRELHRVLSDKVLTTDLSHNLTLLSFAGKNPSIRSAFQASVSDRRDCMGGYCQILLAGYWRSRPDVATTIWSL